MLYWRCMSCSACLAAAGSGTILRGTPLPPLLLDVPLVTRCEDWTRRVLSARRVRKKLWREGAAEVNGRLRVAARPAAVSGRGVGKSRELVWSAGIVLRECGVPNAERGMRSVERGTRSGCGWGGANPGTPTRRASEGVADFAIPSLARRVGVRRCQTQIAQLRNSILRETDWRKLEKSCAVGEAKEISPRASLEG